MSVAFHIIDDETGDIIDPVEHPITDAYRLYPEVYATALRMKREIEMDMDLRGAKETPPIGGVIYEYKASEEWVVDEPMELLDALIHIAAQPAAPISPEEVGAALTTVPASVKANHTKLNLLQKRGKDVAAAIEAFRRREERPARLSMKEVK